MNLRRCPLEPCLFAIGHRHRCWPQTRRRAPLPLVKDPLHHLLHMLLFAGGVLLVWEYGPLMPYYGWRKDAFQIAGLLLLLSCLRSMRHLARHPGDYDA